MPATIADNALNAVNGSAAIDPNTGEVSPAGMTVEFQIEGGPWYTNAGTVVAAGVVPVDQTSGAFEAVLKSTDVDILNPGATYRAVFKRWGSPVAVTTSFLVPDGTVGRIADLIDVIGAEEGQLSGRELAYAEQTADFSTAATSPLVVIEDGLGSPLQVQSAFGARPILVEGFVEFLSNSGGANCALGILIDGTLARQSVANSPAAAEPVSGYVQCRFPANPTAFPVFALALGSGSGGSGTVTADGTQSILVRDL